MAKGPGPMNGSKPGTPKRGANGPGDKGPSSGTKHYAPPKPKGGKGEMTGTKGGK